MAEYTVGQMVEDPGTGQRWRLMPNGEWEEIHVKSGAQAARITGFDKLIRNVLNAPAALEQSTRGLAAGVASIPDTIVRSGLRALQGEPMNVLEQLRDSYSKFLQGPERPIVEGYTSPLTVSPGAEPQIPRFGDFRNIGEDIRTLQNWVDPRLQARAHPDAYRISGGSPPASPTPPMTWNEARERAVLEAQQARELFPKSSTAGEFGADFATMFTARRPARLARSEIARRNRDAAERFRSQMSRARSELDDDLQSHLDDFATKAAKKIKTGSKALTDAGIKSGEAAIEGAFLAALNNDDPVVSAATAAGIQSAGNLGLILSTKPKKALMPFIASTWAAHELWKTFAPGDQSFFESKDFAFQSAAAALALGAVGALTGSGRLGPSYIKHPALADFPTAFLRAGTENRLRELRSRFENNDPLMDDVLTMLKSNPGSFNENQLNSLSRAWDSEKDTAFGDEIDRLMRDSKDFRERVEAFRERRKPPEGTQPYVPPPEAAPPSPDYSQFGSFPSRARIF